MPTIDLGSRGPGFVAQLEERRRHLSVSYDSTVKVANHLEHQGESWRQKICLVVEQMTAPAQIIWTDEEEASSDLCFAQCAILKIKHLFEM